MQPTQPSQLVDEITYLALLASQPKAIDHLLEDLRRITALAGSEINHVSSQDLTTLTQLRQKLKDYLITSEPLRSFTKESLDAQIFDHFAGNRRLRVLRWVTVLTTLVSVAIVALSDMLFGKLGTGGDLETGTLLTPVVLYGAPAVLFLLALSDFAPKMRQAYSMVCAGICLLGMAAIHEVWLDAYMAGTLWSRGGGEMLGYGLAFLVIYLGVRKHAKLMNIDGWFIRMGVFFGVIIAGWLAIVAGGSVVGAPVAAFQLATTLAVALILAFAAAAGHTILRSSGKLYGRAMRWLQWSLVVHVYAVGQYAAAQLLFRDSIGTDLALAILGLPYMVAAILLFIAGYAFNRVGRY